MSIVGNIDLSIPSIKVKSTKIVEKLPEFKIIQTKTYAEFFYTPTAQDTQDREVNYPAHKGTGLPTSLIVAF